ncbi:hypothetical protein [Marinobacter sp.]|uniref:hypothetical protein n=1 Tax=Marinobacter sp. TaxID=50741 RepID=UPI0034A2F27C
MIDSSEAMRLNGKKVSFTVLMQEAPPEFQKYSVSGHVVGLVLPAGAEGPLKLQFLIREFGWSSVPPHGYHCEVFAEDVIEYQVS